MKTKTFKREIAIPREEIEALSKRAAALPEEHRALFMEAVADLSTALEGRHEKKRQKQMAGLASFPELNPQPVMETDVTGHVYYINPAAERLFPGLREGGLDHVWLSGLEKVAASAGKLGKEPFTRELKIGDKWFDQYIFPVMDGRRLRIYGRDITERKRVEEALRESEARFRLALKNAPVSVAAQDRDLRFLWAYNQRTMQPSEVIGKTDADLFAPDDAAWLMALKRKVIETGMEVSELRWIVSNGKRVFVDIFVEPMRDEAGRITGIGIATVDLTPMKLAEDALRDSEERFKLIATNTPDHILIQDADLRYVYVLNPQLGLTEKGMIGRTDHEILSPEDAAAITDIKRRVLETESPEFVNVPLTSPGGAKEYFEGSYIPRRDFRGRVDGILGYFRNVTARVKSEEALAAERANLQAIFDAVNIGMFLIDEAGVVKRINQAVARWGGHEFLAGGAVQPGDAVGCLHALDHPGACGHTSYCSDCPIRGAFESVLRTRRPVHDVEARASLRTDRGEVPLWLEVSADPLVIEGKPHAILALSDITERKQMEAELRKSRDELETRVQERTAELQRQAELLDLANDAIIVRTLDGTVNFWNKGAESMYGWTKGSAMGKNKDELLRPQTSATLEDVNAKLLISGRWEGELTHLGKNGKPILVFSRQVLRSSEAGQPPEILEINQDITERRQAEERVRQWRKMEALGTLAGGIAHDFNNILVPIMINTELAMLDAPKEGSLARNLEIVLEATNRGRELVKQIITFSRQKEQRAEAIDMVTVVKEALRFLRSSISKSIDIREHISIKSALIRADATQIHQVLMNLGGNAAHAMREGGGLLNVSLAELEVKPDTHGQAGDLKPGPYLKLTVADTGHGMARDILERIFDPFFTTKKPGEGAGMGLAVVHGIVKGCGGSITAESEVGKGTTIEILLPRLMGTPVTEPARAKPVVTGKGRILFVDDEEIVVHSIQPMLERLGYRVTSRTSPAEALALFRERPGEFDLVITDQIMPTMTGEKLALEVLGVRPDIPVILATGFSETIQEEEAKTLGIRDFILKPFSVGEIAEKIRQALNKT
jgi:PAS domain S-box-containing protein